MEVEIQNNQLPAFFNLLYGLKLKGKQSRHRSKFIKLLADQLTERDESEAVLRKEHCRLDDEGNPQTKETEKGVMWDIIDEAAFEKDVVDLMSEKLVITGPQHDETIRTVAEALFDTEEEFAGLEAATYATLCELFEKALEAEGEIE